jgi:O-methyltransferase domain
VAARVPAGSNTGMTENTVQLVNLERLQLQQMIMGFRVTQLLHVAATLSLADLLEAGPRSATSLAIRTGCCPDALYRILRALSNIGVVSELPEQEFKLTSLGEHLRTGGDGSLRDMAVLYGEPWLWNAYGNLMHSVRTGQPAFDAVHGTRFFDYLQTDAAAWRSFNAAMTSFSTQEIEAVMAAFDFTRFGTIADIGGGHARLLSAILRSNRTARGILFDLPAVCIGARESLARAGLAERAAVIGGNFFCEVPRGADLYVLKSVIHDWDDDKARQILANCSAAMTPDSRLLLIERLVGEPNEVAESKLFDINMLAMLGGRERTQHEHRALLKSAGLRMTRTLATAGPHSLIEATL